jgi:hypothetical protein
MGMTAPDLFHTMKLTIPDDAKPSIPPGTAQPPALSHGRRRVRADQRLRRGSPRASQGRVDSVDGCLRHLHLPTCIRFMSYTFSIPGFEFPNCRRLSLVPGVFLYGSLLP